MKERSLFKPNAPSLRATALVMLGVGILLWAAWVSHAVLESKNQEIIRVDMAGLMREFVEAEARNNADAESTKASIARYLAATEDALEALEQEGKLILVSEAVLSRNTPDATPEVRTAIARKLRPEHTGAQK